MKKLVSYWPPGPRRLRAGCFTLTLALTAAPAVLAQQSPPSPFTPPPSPAADAPSPVAPGDLTKPAFDTTTPVFTLPDTRKSAATVVAEVEGRAITLGQVGDMINGLPPALRQLPFETLFPQVLQQLIRQEALVVRAQQRGLDEDPDVRRRLQSASDHELADVYIQRETAKDITEARLLDRYKRDFEGHPGPDEVHVRVIVLGTEKEALDQIAAIKGGADFASIAGRFSKDPSGSSGGDIGFLTRDKMTQEVGAVAFSLADGQISDRPVLSEGRWVIVKAEARRPGPTPNFFSVREQLTKQLQHEAALQAVDTAMAGMTIRKYDLAGKEKAGDSPGKE